MKESQMAKTINNKVADSGIITIDPADFFPGYDIKLFDLKDYLYMNLILKEKEYREALKKTEWEQYRNKYVAVTCSADAIIPAWAYMLAAVYLQPVANDMVLGNIKELQRHLFLKNSLKIDLAAYKDKRVVIKGCGDKPVDDSVYLELTRLLRPVVQSIMFGEPCSTVPVYKKSTTVHK